MRSTRLAAVVAALALAPAGIISVATAGNAAAGHSAALVSAYRVSMKASTQEAIARETKVQLSGTVRPQPPEGSKVVVQVKYEHRKSWTVAGTAKVRPNGSYLFVDKPSTSRDRSYRAVKATDAVATRDVSPVREVHVLAWSWLTQVAPSALDNVYTATEMPINGDTYQQTLYGARTKPVSFIEFTLGRNCQTLETTLGLSDRTETGGRATIQLAADGTVFYNRIFDLGQSEPLSLDVAGVYRIRFDMTQVATTPVTEPSAGAARVLCD
jgi:hypothetical protein